MTRLTRTSLIPLLVIILSVYSCRNVPIPKPKGYFRIDLPQKQYIQFKDQPGTNQRLPFTFEYPVYGSLAFKQEDKKSAGWFNIEFPSYKAKIYLTYRDIKGDFGDLMEQTYKMNVKNHIEKADAINQSTFNNEDSKVFGVLYDLKGNTASAVQFYVTDSINHYLRGSLYFAAEPDADSLAPVIEFFRKDIIHLIETLKWEK